jgi:hypothetical protein
MVLPLDNSLTLLWLIFWLVFCLFRKFKIMLLAFTATLIYIFYNLNLYFTDSGLLWFDLLLYAILLLDLSMEKEKR